MTHTLKQRPKSQVELIITGAVADYQKDMETAATRISQRAAIHGFRPGKAPYDIVKQQIGEIKILEEAIKDSARGLGKFKIKIDDETLKKLAEKIRGN